MHTCLYGMNNRQAAYMYVPAIEFPPTFMPRENYTFTKRKLYLLFQLKHLYLINPKKEILVLNSPGSHIIVCVIYLYSIYKVKEP